MRGDFVDRSIENSCNLYSIFETVWFLFGGRTSHLIGIFSVSPTHRTFVLCVSLVPPIPYHDDRLRGEPTLKLEWTNKYAVITYTDFFAANWLAASDDSYSKTDRQSEKERSLCGRELLYCTLDGWMARWPKMGGQGLRIVTGWASHRQSPLFTIMWIPVSIANFEQNDCGRRKTPSTTSLCYTCRCCRHHHHLAGWDDDVNLTYHILLTDGREIERE